MKNQLNWKEIRKDLRSKFPDKICIFNDKRKKHRRIKITTCGNLKTQAEVASYLVMTYPNLKVHRSNQSSCYGGYYNGICFNLAL